MAHDLHRRIADEQARIARFERDYQRACGECVAALSELYGEMMNIRAQLGEAAADLPPPSLRTACLPGDPSHSLDYYGFWEYISDDYPDSPQIRTGFRDVIVYNPVLRRWRMNYETTTPAKILETYADNIVAWGAHTYPRIVQEREKKERGRETGKIMARQEAWEELKRGVTVALTIVAALAAIYYGLLYILTEAAK